MRCQSQERREINKIEKGMRQRGKREERERKEI